MADKISDDFQFLAGRHPSPDDVSEVSFVYSSDDLHDQYDRTNDERVQKAFKNDEQPALRRSPEKGDLSDFRRMQCQVSDTQTLRFQGSEF